MTRAHQIIATVLSDLTTPVDERYLPLEFLGDEPRNDVLSACREFGPMATYHLAQNAAKKMSVTRLEKLVTACLEMSISHTYGGRPGLDIRQGIEHEFESVATLPTYTHDNHLLETLLHPATEAIKIGIIKKETLPDYGDETALYLALDIISETKIQKKDNFFNVRYAYSFINPVFMTMALLLEEETTYEKTGLKAAATSLAVGTALLPSNGYTHIGFDYADNVSLREALKRSLTKMKENLYQGTDVLVRAAQREELEMLESLLSRFEKLITGGNEQFTAVLANPVAQALRLYTDARQERIAKYLAPATEPGGKSLPRVAP